MAQPDTSLYPKPPSNPFEIMQGYANLQHTEGENQLQQQTIKGKMAVGEIVARNTDRNGRLNAPNFLREVSQDPNARLYYLQEQEQYKNANPLTGYIGTDTQGRAAPAQAPLFDIPGAYPNAAPETPNALYMNDTENPAGAPPSQEQIDEAHAHNDAMMNHVEPLANDPNVDHKKVIGAVSDLVADPSAKFSAMDGAGVLSQMPSGQNGASPTPQDLHQHIQPVYNALKEHKQILDEHYPSSAQLKARETAAQFAANPVQLVGPGIVTGLPAGYSSPQVKSRANYDDVNDAAKNAGTQTAAYNEVINLVNSGAPSGTNIANMYQWATKNIPGISKDISDPAVQAQELGKYMAQGLIQNGVPPYASQVQDLQHANLNPDQFPETIKNLAPLFKAMAQGAVAKSEFYNKLTNNGNDLSKEPAAALLWAKNYDPRWIELDAIKDKKEQRKFLTKHPDLIDSIDKQENLVQMGVVKPLRKSAGQ